VNRSSSLWGKWPGVQLLSCIVVVFLVVKETHKLFFQNSVHKYFPLSAVRIFVSDFSNFDCHVSCLVWISLGLSCLGFTQFLEHVTSHLLSNLGSFCPLFFLVLFQYCSLLLLFQDFNDTNVSCFIIVSRVPAALFIFFNVFFHSVLQFELFVLICFQVHGYFLL